MNKHLLHPKYRPDIDGLRAIAILSVVVFHAFPEYLRGGFIGVDVFFVISGYLISTIIFENLDQGTFSFSEFYARRIRRIFPALILVLFASVIFGWFVLLADEYKQLGKHIAVGSGFFSNIVLWQEAGYFDNLADTKPLLHLWSLGIEEQFYAVWPLLLWLAWKSKFNLLKIAILAAMLSFVLNLLGVREDAVSTFYLPQTRFWELLSGSVLSWFFLHKKHLLKQSSSKASLSNTALNVISFVGMLLLLYGFFRINKGLSFPGKWALVPVLGSVLIIYSGQNSWVNRVVLSNKIAIWFGTVSFPLYLWHWPLLSFSRIYLGETPAESIRIAIVIFSIFLAWLTCEFIERKFRFGNKNKEKLAVLVALMAIIGAVGFLIYRSDGLPTRPYNQKLAPYKDSMKVSDKKAQCFDIPYAYKKNGSWFCSLGARGDRVNYFAYGDSHALSLLPALERFASNYHVGVNFAGSSGCPSLLGIQSMRGESDLEKFNCKALNERVFNFVKTEGIKNVVLISRWTYYMGSISRPLEFNLVAKDEKHPFDRESSMKDILWAMQNTVSRYKRIGVNVIFVEDNPQQKFEPKDVLRRGNGNDSIYFSLSVSRKEHEANQKIANEAIKNVNTTFINFDDVLCNKNVCPLVNNSRFIYSDDDHLSVNGANRIYPVLVEGLLDEKARQFMRMSKD